MRRALQLLLLVLAVSALFGGAASAGTIRPLITFDPAVPQPGQTGTVEVRLFDPNGTAIPAKVRATMSAMDELPPAAVPLTEQQPGVFSAKFRFPEMVAAQLRVEVEIPDNGTSRAQLMFRVGEGGFPVQKLPVDLFDEGETGDNGKPYGLPADAGTAPTHQMDGMADMPGMDHAAPAPARRPFPWAVAGGLVIALVGGGLILKKRR